MGAQHKATGFGNSRRVPEALCFQRINADQRLGYQPITIFDSMAF
jgi:hypothetical protein